MAHFLYCSRYVRQLVKRCLRTSPTLLFSLLRQAPISLTLLPCRWQWEWTYKELYFSELEGATLPLTCAYEAECDVSLSRNVLLVSGSHSCAGKVSALKERKFDYV
ncbi:hypothetical protein TRVL_09961 [Trypanosoma vivax]|nr:hypothetical protein TRVL_09961 [Trypanosoma vivax]